MIYAFSGLGADERVFKHLEFGNHPIQFIKWAKPKGTSIEEYAKELLSQIHDPKPILVGLSFGGMVVIEVARLITTEKVILISSAKNRYEIPAYYRITGSIGIHQLMPMTLAKKPNRITNWLFGDLNEEHRILLAEILKDTDPLFLKWAVNSILNWKNKNYPENIVHIHGTSDRILPIRLIKNAIPISGGGHLMTLTHSEEINQIFHSLI